MSLVASFLKLFGRKQIHTKFSREEMARHIRSGAIRVTCADCGGRMMPNAARRIECLGCGKAMTAGDRTKVLREIKNSGT